MSWMVVSSSGNYRQTGNASLPDGYWCEIVWVSFSSLINCKETVLILVSYDKTEFPQTIGGALSGSALNWQITVWVIDTYQDIHIEYQISICVYPHLSFSCWNILAACVQKNVQWATWMSCIFATFYIHKILTWNKPVFCSNDKTNKYMFYIMWNKNMHNIWGGGVKTLVKAISDLHWPPPLQHRL